MGEVVYGIDFRAKPIPRYEDLTLEQQAIEIMNVALLGNDTAPAEYTAPDQDSA